MLDEFISIKSFYEKAKTMLPEDVFTFISSGSLDEKALNRNKQKFEEVLILPRILRALKNINTSCQVFNTSIAAPILIAPTAYHKIISDNGELDMLEAANQYNSIFITSMFSSTDYALLAKKSKGPIWLQMYLLKDRRVNARLIQIAAESGYSAIVLTVDTPIYAKREKELQSPLKLPNHITFSHLENIGIPVRHCLSTKEHFSQLIDPTIGWEDIEWIINQSKLPIILKGVMSPKDTSIAISYQQISGLVISNHGGRQLNSTFATLELVTEHKKIIGDKLSLFIDGGFSRGEDIFKAIALGADAVLIGRAMLWALALKQEAKGVLHALNILRQELIETMLLAGCSSLNEINHDTVYVNVKKFGL